MSYIQNTYYFAGLDLTPTLQGMQLVSSKLFQQSGLYNDAYTFYEDKIIMLLKS